MIFPLAPIPLYNPIDEPLSPRQQNSYKTTDHVYDTPDCTNNNNTEMMECVAYGVVKK